nr:thioesterase II family protein [Paenibacillus elgii]
MISRSPSWFLNAEASSRMKLRLFCFPYAGGGASIFGNWKREFPPEIKVCPVQLPGRESRALESPLNSLPDIVHSLVSEMTPFLHSPFAFFGHSMGALIAFETARKLYREHHVLPAHFFASGKAAPHYTSRKKILHRLPDDQFKDELRLIEGTPEEILDNDELMQIVMPRLRSDFAVCETYVYRPEEPLSCPITVFGGAQDHEVSIDSLRAWQEHTSSEFKLQLFEGNHFFLHQQETEVIDSMMHVLSSPKKPAVFRQDIAHVNGLG